MSTANNHSFDCGESGVLNTIEALDRNGISHSGTNCDPKSARRGALIERNGISVGVISWTFGTNGKVVPPERPWLVNVTNLNADAEEVDLTKMKEQIDNCRSHAADLIVAQLHWGLEHEYFPRSAQVRLGHRIAELGVDAIFGHHAHVVQRAELYRTRRDPDRIVPIYYSLGNLITPFLMEDFRKSTLAQLTFALQVLPNGNRKVLLETARSRSLFLGVDEANEQIRLALH